MAEQKGSKHPTGSVARLDVLKKQTRLYRLYRTVMQLWEHVVTENKRMNPFDR